MSIRPVDLQIIVQKTQEVEKLQQTQQKQSQVQQQQFGAHSLKESETKERRVNSTPLTDEVEIEVKERQEDKQQMEEESELDKDQAEEEAESPSEETPSHVAPHIDIKI